jgi:hypothetical protein
MLANLTVVSTYEIANNVGVEQIGGRHLEEIPLDWRGLIAFQDILVGRAEGIPDFEPLLPRNVVRLNLGREKNFACCWVSADKYLGAFEAEFFGEADGLAAAVLEELGGFGGGCGWGGLRRFRWGVCGVDGCLPTVIYTVVYTSFLSRY